jgi:hypothetical protein
MQIYRPMIWRRREELFSVGLKLFRSLKLKPLNNETASLTEKTSQAKIFNCHLKK